MKVHFRPCKHGPESLVGEAEVHFEDGPLAGTRLLGFGLWRDAQGQVYVTFPSRAKGAGRDRLYVDFLRSVDGGPEALRRVKTWILEEYRKRTGATV